MAPRVSGVLTVRLAHELPVGQGFGMSAAGALATALAVGSLSDGPRAHAIQVAHLADLFGGGGLGGVAAILGGGLEVRTRPGLPPFGQVIHRKLPHALLVGVVGRAIPSPSVLGDPAALERITAASRGWEQLGPNPTMERFFRFSERFTDRAGLASPAVTRTVAALRRRGASACQAMFGQSFFALPRTAEARASSLDWLQREGIRAVELHAASTGAHLVRERTDEVPPSRAQTPRAPQAF
jgi:pantoate kinase